MRAESRWLLGLLVGGGREGEGRGGCEWHEKGGMGGRTIGKLECGMERGGGGRVEFLKMGWSWRALLLRARSVSRWDQVCWIQGIPANA